MKIRSLFWHSVDPDSIDPGTYDGTNPRVSAFREQIRFIVDNYTPLSIQEFMGSVGDGGPAPAYPKPPILLGFDDGFRNVVTCALPVLREFNVPAVFFVLGVTLDNPEFVPWYVEVKHLIRRTGQKAIAYGSTSIDLCSKTGPASLRVLAGQAFKACRSDEEREAVLTNLASLLKVKRPAASELDEDLQFVGSEELAGLDSTTLLSVASHGMTHRNLGSLTYQEQVYELERSNELFSSHCASYYPVLSYPDGSFNGDTIEVARRIYEFAFAVFLGSSFRDHYAYPRHSLSDIGAKELKYTLSPFRVTCLLPMKKLLHYAGLRRL